MLKLIRSEYKSNKCAWVISFTPVVNEPRVLRQTEALVEDGWSVVVVGYEGHSKRPDNWNYIQISKKKVQVFSVLFLNSNTLLAYYFAG